MFSGLGDVSPFATRELRPPGGFGWEPPRPSVGEVLGDALFWALLMGPNGAAMAAGQQQGLILEARRKWTEPLTQVVNADKAFQHRMLTAITSALTSNGYPVGRVVISPDAKGSVLSRAAKDERRAVVVRPQYAALAGLTADDRRVVFNAWIEFHERPADRFRERSARKVRYASAPVATPGAIDAWAREDAKAFWDAIEQGIGHAVLAAMHPVATPADIGPDEVATLATQVRGERFAGRVVRREGDMVWVAERGGDMTVVHDAVPVAAP